MAFSDDEGETLAESVTNYHFVDDRDEPISFSILPIQWCEGEMPGFMKKAVFLHGVADDGLQKIYKQVTAWKFELLDEKVEVSVLSKEKNWIKLLKPRKIFEDTVRPILVTVHCLHIVKKHPETLGNSLWDQLWKYFSSYEVRPYEKDLFDHLPLIKAAIKHDETLAKSKFLVAFLENPGKRKAFDEDAHTGLVAKSKFIVDDDEELDEDTWAADEDGSDEETDLFDSVCSFCDNGGELLCCEGRCMRSFHATREAGEESKCKSLGFSKAQVKAIQNFLCLNCQSKRHQCFACGKLGSSDKSSGAEVFHCVSATCGYFYHPECVANLLHPANEAEADEMQEKISAGESFTCPAHKCYICKQREDKDVPELQFAVCRRCPKAYHRKCMPRKIAFEDLEEEDIITRAWDGLLPNNRVLIYCLKHKIDEILGTPIRDHIKFPHVEEKKKVRSLDLQLKKRKAVAESRFVVTDDWPSETFVSKPPKQVQKVSYDVKDSGFILKKREKPISDKEFDSWEKSKIIDTAGKPTRDSIKSAVKRVDKSRVSLGEERLNSVVNKGLDHVNSTQHDVPSSKFERTIKSSQMKKQTASLLVDAETKKKIMTLMEKKISSITLEEVVKKHKVPSTHAYSSKSVVDKTITQGKVEGFVEAVRTALQKLEEGGSVEDAKAVCGPEIVNQILKWKNKLKVYLAPFLHGMRYTSFGRHFTKVDKLTEIVDKLHWYAQNGDMIVDFCCGANDFSLLMKQKLDETGKRCTFKNFDVIQPKNDFSFEKRDWMTVHPKELPTGSNLIMGLNPPFGVRAALANKFIDKALEFKPKLLILIVPPETQRLDKKKSAYDLVWEDDEKLSGKSFYLPGSVDVNDNQMEQWNLKPPVLYLWSRPDWTASHKAIALLQGHVSKERKKLQCHVSKKRKKLQGHASNEWKELHVEENYNESQLSEPMDISPNHDRHGVISELKNEYGDANQINDLPEQNNEVASLMERQDKAKLRHMAEIRADGTPPNVTSPSNQTDPRRSMDGHPSARSGSEEDIQHFQPGPLSSVLDHRTGYDGTGTSIPGDHMDRMRYGTEGGSLASGTSTWPIHGQQYGLRGVDEQFPSYINNNVGRYGGVSYTNALDDYRRDVTVRHLLRRYGGPNPDSLSPSSHLPGQETGFGLVGALSSAPYGLSGMAADSSYNRVNSSAMQRYAPRLDELNPTRISTLGPMTPLMGGNGMFNSPVSQYTPGSRPGFRPNISGFATAPPHPFSHQSSSGWLNE